MLRQGEHIAVLAAGDQVYPALEMAERLSEDGVSAEVVNMRFIKPIDLEYLKSAVYRFPAMVTMENNSIIGGLGGAVSEYLAEQHPETVLRRFGLPDKFVAHGELCRLFADVNLDIESVAKSIQELLETVSDKVKAG